MIRNEFVCDCNVIHEEVVTAVKEKMPDKNILTSLATFFKIVGDDTRIKILFALDQQEMCVCDIANLLKMTKSSISHQLAILRKAKIVKCRKEAKQVYYTLDDDHVSRVFELGLEHIHHQTKGENL